MDLVGSENEASSSLMSQSSASLCALCEAWDGRLREPAALLMEPVRVRPVAEDDEGARLSCTSSAWTLVEGEGMYDRLVRLPLLGVSTPVPVPAAELDAAEAPTTD